MKIIVRSKEKVEEKITLDDIEPGTVFQYGNGPIGLKLQEDEVALLKFSNGHDWFELSDGTMDHFGIEILGRLDEVIVVEE